MSILLFVSILLNLVAPANNIVADKYYHTDSGEVSFTSYAALETIQATSKKLKGIIDPDSRKFAFSVSIPSFYGFNSPLQKDHFNENFMESNIFPQATFSGKIIERIDFSKNGTYKVRTKGKFKLHGVDQERIIKSTLTINENVLIIKSKFTVILKEHNILIPKIVNQKIAKEIEVSVNTELKRTPD